LLITSYRSSAFVSLATVLVAAVATVHCGSSPAAPGNGMPALSAVALNAASVVPGSTTQGTVTVASAAPTGGESIALSSSNSAVATVPASVMIQAGSSSSTFTITAVGPGTAVITASANGSSRQSPMLTVAASSVALAAIELSASSVIGGTTLIGSVNLTAPAPPGGAIVSLSSADPVSVPASVTVPAGSSTAPFTITTRAVGGNTSVAISGSYGGGSASAMLAITRATVATASFGVSGPTETSTCELANGGNTLNCTFNGSTSTAPGTITAWDWTYGVATMFTQPTTGPVLTMPAINCTLLPPPPLPPGNPWFMMVVTLKVHDNQGNVSTVTTDSGVRLLPQGSCGF